MGGEGQKTEPTPTPGAMRKAQTPGQPQKQKRRKSAPSS